MPIVSEETTRIPLPKMYSIKQVFPHTKVEQVKEVLSVECKKLSEGIITGSSVAIAVGSRGIHQLALIVYQVITEVKKLGAHPFIVAAMGSHGGATESGQREVLASYGITQEAMGVPIDCSMETLCVGETSSHVPVHVASSVLQADAVILIARIKPHTDYRGAVESGLCKMLAIGLGKHTGCSRLHKEGFSEFHHLIPDVSTNIISHIKQCYGLAIVENGYDETALLEMIPAQQFLQREPELLKLAKQYMPSIPFSHCDVLIIDYIGKDISGAGMDPNIVGRTTKGILDGYTGPSISRIIIKHITEVSHGNAIGIGLADFCLDSLLSSIDYEATYANSIASGNPESAKIPIALPSVELAVQAAISCIPSAKNDSYTIIQIKNTLDLTQLWISESLLEEAQRNEYIKIVGEKGCLLEDCV